MVYANFAGSAASCTARGSAGGVVRLFRGRTAISGAGLEWQLDIADGEAGYLPLLWSIRGSLDGLFADIPGSRSGTLCNGSRRTLSFELSRAGGPEWKPVTLPAGAFLRLE